MPISGQWIICNVDGVALTVRNSDGMPGTGVPVGEEVVVVPASEIERLREALTEIRDADPVDMALDPNWPARIAAEALSAS